MRASASLFALIAAGALAGEARAETASLTIDDILEGRAPIVLAALESTDKVAKKPAAVGAPTRPPVPEAAPEGSAPPPAMIPSFGARASAVTKESRCR